jgi:hypothetical protein
MNHQITLTSEALAHLRALSISGVVEAAKQYPKGHGELLTACHAVALLHYEQGEGQDDARTLVAAVGLPFDPRALDPRCAHGMRFTEPCEECDKVTEQIERETNPLNDEPVDSAPIRNAAVPCAHGIPLDQPCAVCIGH